MPIEIRGETTIKVDAGSVALAALPDGKQVTLESKEVGFTVDIVRLPLGVRINKLVTPGSAVQLAGGYWAVSRLLL